MIIILIYSTIYLLLFGFTDLLYHVFKWKAENSRKIAHIFTGLISLTFPKYIEDAYQVYVLSASFILLLLISEKFSWFKSITAVERKTYGTWIFAFVVSYCFFLFKYFNNVELYYLPLLILSLSDPIAATVGNLVPLKTIKIIKHSKSIGGFIAFTISTGLILVFLSSWGDHYLLVFALALLIASVELVSINGWDNLTIPLVSSLGLLLFNFYL